MATKKNENIKLAEKTEAVAEAPKKRTRKKKVEAEAQVETRKKLTPTELIKILADIKGESDDVYEYSDLVEKKLNEMGLIRKFIPVDTKIKLAQDVVKEVCYDGDKFIYNSNMLEIYATVVNVMTHVDIDWSYGNLQFTDVYDIINEFDIDVLCRNHDSIYYYCDNIISDIERNELSVEAQIRDLMSMIKDAVGNTESEISEAVNSPEFIKNITEQFVEAAK